jgi:hypothetical protein
MPWLRAHRGVVLTAASLLATVAVWIPAYPPMCDLPQHAAQVTLMRALHDPGFAYSYLFQTNWFTPYLVGYALIYVLAPLLGIVLACKVVVTLALAGLPLSTALLLRETGSDVYWALLTIPAMYGFSYHWGLINYLLATPLGMIFLWLVMRHTRAPSVKSSLALAVLINVLFFCHALICAFFGLISAGYVICSRKTFKETLLGVAPLAAVIPVMVIWALKALSPRQVVNLPVVWGLDWFNIDTRNYYGSTTWAQRPNPGWGRINGFFPRVLGTRPSLVWTIYGIALFSLPLLAGARFRRRPAMWVPLIVCAAMLLFLPEGAFDAAFVHARFAVFALPFFLFALEPRGKSSVPRNMAVKGKASKARKKPAFGLRREHLVAALGTGLVILWIAVVSLRAVDFDSQVKGFENVLSRMEPGQRVLSLMGMREDASSIAPTFLHFTAWYSAEKRGVVDPNFAAGIVEMVVYRPAGFAEAPPRGFEWYPRGFNWQQTGGYRYRYFVVRSLTDPGGFLFGNAPCSVRLDYQENAWWLYEKDPGCNAPGATGSRQ